MLTKTWQANNTDSFMPEEVMYVILDVVVGGDWAPAPTDASVSPQYTYFDYVRVYQKAEGDTTQPESPVTATYRIKNAASDAVLTADGGEEEWLTPFQADWIPATLPKSGPAPKLETATFLYPPSGRSTVI